MPKSQAAESTTTPIKYDFSKFHLIDILKNNCKEKSIIVLGKFLDINDTDKAVVILEKKSFSDIHFGNINCKRKIDEDMPELLDAKSYRYFSNKTLFKEIFLNDIYANYECYPLKNEMNAIKTTIIYPATDKHIKKYSTHEIHLIDETPELYEKLTVKYLEKEKFTLDWVYNILNRTKESERIVYEDACPQTGFMLLPDLKWDGFTKETLYLLAIVHRKDIKSLRDLNETHLDLLKNIRTKTRDIIQEKYHLNGSQLRMYVHYQPSFYHFHIHINALEYDAPGIHCEKGHLLTTIIDNIQLIPNYYQKATLPFVVQKTDAFYELYQKYLNE